MASLMTYLTLRFAVFLILTRTLSCAHAYVRKDSSMHFREWKETDDMPVSLHKLEDEKTEVDSKPMPVPYKLAKAMEMSKGKMDTKTFAKTVEDARAGQPDKNLRVGMGKKGTAVAAIGKGGYAKLHHSKKGRTRDLVYAEKKSITSGRQELDIYRLPKKARVTKVEKKRKRPVKSRVTKVEKKRKRPVKVAKAPVKAKPAVVKAPEKSKPAVKSKGKAKPGVVKAPRKAKPAVVKSPEKSKSAVVKSPEKSKPAGAKAPVKGKRAAKSKQSPTVIVVTNEG